MHYGCSFEKYAWVHDGPCFFLLPLYPLCVPFCRNIEGESCGKEISGNAKMSVLKCSSHTKYNAKKSSSSTNSTTLQGFIIKTWSTLVTLLWTNWWVCECVLPKRSKSTDLSLTLRIWFRLDFHFWAVDLDLRGAHLSLGSKFKIQLWLISPQCYWSFYIIFFQNFHKNHLHAEKIHPPSPNLQRMPGHVAHPSGPKVMCSSSAVTQLQEQHSRSPTNPIPVPKICISPQSEINVKLRRQSPENPAECNLRNYNSWNTKLGNEYRRRSASHSPCRRGEPQSWNNENGNSLQHNILKLSSSQECLMSAGQIDLSASTPEHSLRKMLGCRERRIYSVPRTDFLGVPQFNFLPSVSHLKEKKNNKKDKLCSSHHELSSSNLDVDLECSKVNGQNIPRPKSTCGQDWIWLMSDMSQKSKPGLFDSVKSHIKSLCLSPRGSPRHSPASSRTASPNNSPTPSTPCSSPLSHSIELSDRPF